MAKSDSGAFVKKTETFKTVLYGAGSKNFSER